MCLQVLLQLQKTSNHFQSRDNGPITCIYFSWNFSIWWSVVTVVNILNILSTISFSYSVDMLDDRLDIKDEDKEGNLFLFSHLNLDFLCLVFVGAFYYLRAWWGAIFFPFPWLVSLIFCLLVEEVSRFSDTLFASSSHDLFPALLYFCPATSLDSTAGEITIGSCWYVCSNSASFKLLDIINCTEYVSLACLF